MARGGGRARTTGRYQLGFVSQALQDLKEVPADVKPRVQAHLILLAAEGCRAAG